MKLIFSFLLLLGSALTVTGQEPVQWQFSAVKKEGKVYEVRLMAQLQKGWHIYSMGTPEGGPLPTKVVFAPNPLLSMDGAMGEVGKKEKQWEEVFDVDTEFYSGQVQFIQTVRLKANAKTKLSGTIEYMLCNDHQCLPPTKKSFTLAIQ